MATAGGELIPSLNKKLKLAQNESVILDLDVFIRSDRDFPYIIPDLRVNSDHRTTIVITREGAENPVMAVNAGKGTWCFWDEKDFKDSSVRIHYDIWNHVQMVLNVSQGKFTVSVQPLGELPKLLGEGRWGEGTKVGDEVGLAIRPSKSGDHLSYYDNVLLTLQKDRD